MEKIYYVKPKEIKNEVSLMDILLGKTYDTDDIPNTTTVRYTSDMPGYYNMAQINRFIEELREFNLYADKFRSMDRWNELYTHFKIPKKSGGLRPIDAPTEEFKSALTMLRQIIERNIGNYFHHPAAFAYVRERCPKKLVEVHQRLKSRWFAHFDFSNFFGSTTLDFVLRMCAKIYPLNIVMKMSAGKEELSKALELCFLNGGLPQGTPMSPFITNVMMIPIDHELLRFCGKVSEPHLIYTRYADDLVISSRYDFDYHSVEDSINAVLRSFDAPFAIKKEKTHYGNIAGRNWILGVMLNKDYKITVGHEKKKRFKAMLVNYILSCKKGVMWDLDDVYHFQGCIAHYRNIEPEYFDYIIEQYNKKFGVNVKQMIRAQIKGEQVVA